MIQINYILILYYISILFHISVQDCNLRYANDFAKRESVLLSKSKTEYDLIKPSNDSIVLKPNEMIWLACPGPKNKFKKFASNFINATCVSEQTLKVTNRKYKLRKLGCKIKVTGQHKETNETCGKDGIMKNIGYKIEENFKPLFNVCYNNLEGITLYTHHNIYGSALNYGSKSSKYPPFSTMGLPAGISFKAYKIKNELKTFTKLLGSKKLAQKYINFKNSYLAAGHLAPVADMIFTTSQSSTYFYINAIPQWEQINNGNWKSIETSVRKLATKLNENFQVYTGTHDVLTLPDIDGNQAKIYLSMNKLPVPKFIWKIIHFNETGIAFINVNNPFVEESTPELYLCKDICKDSLWGTSDWSILSKGLVYCCDVNDLRKSIPNIPKLKVSNILKGKINETTAIVKYIRRNHANTYRKVFYIISES